MNGVAAKIAEEVLMFLDDKRSHPCPGEQQSSHHAGGPAAGDQQVGFFIHHSRLSCSFAPDAA